MKIFDKGFMLNDWRAVYVGLKKTLAYSQRSIILL